MKNMKKKSRRGRLLAFALAFLLLTLFVTADRLLGLLPSEGETVVVPQLIGRTLSEAEGEQDLQIKPLYRYDGQVPEGRIFAQEPVAGVKRKRAADGAPLAVTVYVSLGSESVTLPHVTDMDERAAVALLERHGLTVRVERCESGRAEGLVLASTPKAGTQLPKGAEVLLTVSGGRSVEVRRMPRLYGLSESEAMLRLWSMRISRVEAVEEASVLPRGRVTRQEPPPGADLTDGTRVYLYISSGRETEDAEERDE